MIACSNKTIQGNLMNTLAKLVAIAAALSLGSCNSMKSSWHDMTAGSSSKPANAAAATTTTPSFSDPKVQHGYQVFEKWCAPCHAPGPRHPGTQALEAKYKGTDTPAPLEERKDLTPDLVKYFVRNGVSIMPPFRKTEITDAELDDLGAYLSRQH
jgi:(+)-pinoresinol hydroxylase